MAVVLIVQVEQVGLCLFPRKSKFGWLFRVVRGGSPQSSPRSGGQSFSQRSPCTTARLNSWRFRRFLSQSVAVMVSGKPKKQAEEQLFKEAQIGHEEKSRMKLSLKKKGFSTTLFGKSD